MQGHALHITHDSHSALHARFKRWTRGEVDDDAIRVADTTASGHHDPHDHTTRQGRPNGIAHADREDGAVDQRVPTVLGECATQVASLFVDLEVEAERPAP